MSNVVREEAWKLYLKKLQVKFLVETIYTNKDDNATVVTQKIYSRMWSAAFIKTIN